MDGMSEADRFFLCNKRFFQAYGIGREAAMKYLIAVAADPSSVLYSSLQASASSFRSSEAAEEGVKLEKKKIHIVLDPRQQAVVLSAWGDVYDLEFLGTLRVGHPMPAVMRILECDIILSLCDHSSTIIDIGGNFSHHVRHMRRNVHSCCPKSTLRDKARHSTRVSEIRSVANGSGKASKFAKEVLDNLSLVTCDNKGERCKVVGKTLIWIHSIYDMEIGDLGLQMDSHAGEVGFGVFMYSDSVLDEDSGRLPEIDAYFEKRDKKIMFGFRNDPSFNYPHNFESYKDFLVDRVIEGEDCSYYYRVFPTDRNSMMFTLTRLDTLNVLPIVVKDNLIVRSTKQSVSLTVYDVNWAKSASDPMFLVSQVVRIPPDFYHKALSFCFARMRDDVATEPLDFTQFMRQCRSYNRFLDFNGRPIMGVDKVPVSIFNKVVTSLFHLGAMITAYRRVHTGIVIKDIQTRRSLADRSLLRSLLRYGKTFLPNGKVFRFLVDDFRLMLLDRVNNDLLYVVAEEEKKYRHLESMSVISNMTVVPFDLTHVTERDLTDSWSVTEDDLDLVADLLEAEGSDGLSAKLRSRERKEPAGVLTPTHTEGEATLVPDEEEETESQEEAAEYRRQITNQSDDPKDRDLGDAYRKSAIDEFVVYLRKSYDKDIGSVKSQALEGWSGSAPDRMYCTRKMNTVESPNYLKFSNGTLVTTVVPLTSDSYMWGYDPVSKQLCRITGSTKLERGGTLRSDHEGWLFVSTELVVLNSMMIADAVEDRVKKRGYGINPVVHLSAGVAGSGKSTRIRNAHLPGDMILTATKACSEDMRDKLKAFGDDPASPYKYTDVMLDRFIRTADSFFLKSNQTCEVLRFDEALLLHFGAVAAAAMMCGAKVVYLSGDRVQIPFLNRIESIFKLSYASLRFYDHYELWTRSYRMTQDTMKAANYYYYDGLGRTSNPVENGIELVKIVDTADSRLQQTSDRANLAMSFYKAERAELRKRTRCSDVRTVHESQGRDEDETVLVRFNDKDVGGLYSGPRDGGQGHVLVGFTRHKKRLTVFHKGPDDFIMEFFRKGKEPMNKDLYVFNPEIHKSVIQYF